jgi:hypothetical protein
MEERWDVIEEIDFGQREDCPYWRGVMVYHHSFLGFSAQEKAKNQSSILLAQGKKVTAQKANNKPVRPSLPYQGIARLFYDK